VRAKGKGCLAKKAVMKMSSGAKPQLQRREPEKIDFH
jgi:hypothetical protein